TVQRLRERKHREAKPFALMVPDIETARQLCHVSDTEADLLRSRQRPIVLLRQRDANLIAPAVAPAYQTLGIMLPYTPLHHLLLNAFHAMREPGKPDACVAGQAQGTVRKGTRPVPTVLVMTSGNRSDEPIAYEDDDARERLSFIADGLLTSNRA